MKDKENEVNSKAPQIHQRVCFRPNDDVYHLPIDLANDDAEFIKVAQIILDRMENAKKEKHASGSLFRRVFRKQSDLTSTNCGSSTMEYDYVLTPAMLREFKRAMLIRLEDDSNSNSSPSSSSSDKSTFIPPLISTVIRYMDDVGWPKADVESEHYQNKQKLQNISNNQSNFIRSVLAKEDHEKSCDWSIFYHEEVVVNNQNHPNAARSAVPPDCFNYPSYTGIKEVPSKERNGYLNYTQAPQRMDPAKAKDNLTMFDSPGKATEEIRRLRDIHSHKYVDAGTKFYCMERIRYLNLIIEDNGYYKI